MSVYDIPLRRPGQNLTWKEINSLLLFTRNQYDARHIVSSTYGTSFRQTVEDDGCINAYFNITVPIPPYSIFTLSDISVGGVGYRPDKAYVEGVAVIDPQITGDPYPFNIPPDPYFYPRGLGNPPSTRTIYLTNGNQEVYGGTAIDCQIIGTETARQIRYAGVVPSVGSRMEYTPNFVDAFTVKVSNQGPFVAVSVGDTVTSTVWIVAFLPERPDLAWVRTTIDQDNPETAVYPFEPANTFVVERGILTYTRVPGNSPWGFIPYSPRQLYVAFHPCGYLEQGTVCRMSVDRGYYYLFEECQASSVSSSSISSSSLSSSSLSSSSLSSSSLSSSSSSILSSSSSSSVSSSSSSAPSSSSSVPSSSSSISSSSISSSSVSSSSLVCEHPECGTCYCEWNGTEWTVFDTCDYGPPGCDVGGCPLASPANCPGSGTFVGQQHVVCCLFAEPP